MPVIKKNDEEETSEGIGNEAKDEDEWRELPNLPSIILGLNSKEPIIMSWNRRWRKDSPSRNEVTCFFFLFVFSSSLSLSLF